MHPKLEEIKTNEKKMGTNLLLNNKLGRDSVTTIGHFEVNSEF